MSDTVEVKTVYRTSITTEDYVVDEIFKDNEFKYIAVFKSSKEWIEIPEFPHPPRVFLPVENYDDIERCLLFLPEEPINYGKEEGLDKELYDFLDYWCDYPDEFKILDVAYIKMTWVFDWLITVPYRRALGEWGTGKSRWAECMLALSKIGFKQGATATAAGIYRRADRWRGVQGFDENDYGGKSNIARMIQLVLNCSYKKTSGAVVRMIKAGDDFVDKSFVCYGPKIIAARNTFNDIATESRCITHRCYKSTKVPFEVTDDFYKSAQVLRNKLLMWRINHIDKVPLEIKRFERALINEKVDPRLIEISKPLTRFLSNDNQLGVLAGVIGHSNDLLKAEKFFTREATVLRSVSSLLEEGKPPVMGDIAQRINEVEGRMRWQKCTAREVASVLRSLQLLVKQRYVKEKNTNPTLLIIEGRYVKDLIDRMVEYNVEVPKILQGQFEKQVREKILKEL